MTRRAGMARNSDDHSLPSDLKERKILTVSRAGRDVAFASSDSHECAGVATAPELHISHRSPVEDTVVYTADARTWSAVRRAGDPHRRTKPEVSPAGLSGDCVCREEDVDGYLGYSPDVRASREESAERSSRCPDLHSRVHVFCATCTDGELGGICPNCGGDLVQRPTRPHKLYERYIP